jgi:hypothetical protein
LIAEVKIEVIAEVGAGSWSDGNANRALKGDSIDESGVD